MMTRCAFAHAFLLLCEETPMSANAVHPVDERLPAARLAALGLQHVLVIYAGAIAVPLIVAVRSSSLPNRWRC